jgi:hypothetical protein
MPKKSKKDLAQEQNAKISAILNNYTTWEQDFGFLSLIITREVNLHKLFILETYSMQLEGAINNAVTAANNAASAS